MAKRFTLTRAKEVLNTSGSTVGIICGMFCSDTVTGKGDYLEAPQLLLSQPLWEPSVGTVRSYCLDIAYNYDIYNRLTTLVNTLNTENTYSDDIPV